MTIRVESPAKMATQCQARLVNDKITGLFADGHHKFHHELRCNRITLESSELCGRCQERKEQDSVKKCHPSRVHGLITEKIPEWSHIFGGEWYLKSSLKYGTPPEIEMGKAKAAKEIAYKGVDTTSVAKTETEIVTVTEPQIQTQTQTETVKKKRPYIKRKKVETTISETKIKTLAIESKEPPITLNNVVRIGVRPHQIEGRKYFLDSNKGKLYTVAADKSPGHYYGRWNPQEETVDTNFPDSDAE